MNKFAHEFETVDTKSGRRVSPQSFATDDDWEDFDVVDPRSGKQVEPQPFAADDDWEDFDVVDPRSGKQVEPQPFAHSNPQAVMLDPEPVGAQEGCETLSPAPAHGASTAARMPVILQELVVLQSRGWPVKLAKHRVTARTAAIFRGHSGRRYLIDVQEDGNPVVLFKDSGTPVELPLDVPAHTGGELLLLISHMDQCCFGAGVQ